MILEARAKFDGDRLRKAFEVDGICILASVYAVDDTCVDVWLDADVELNEARCAAAYDRIAFYLRTDPHLATPFEAACRTILTRRFAIPVARAINERIRATWGTAIVRGGVRYRAFPSASRLSLAGDEALRAAGVPSAKLPYLRSAIDAFTHMEKRSLHHGVNALIAARPEQAPTRRPSACEREIHLAAGHRRDSRREVPR